MWEASSRRSAGILRERRIGLACFTFVLCTAEAFVTPGLRSGTFLAPKQRAVSFFASSRRQHAGGGFGAPARGAKVGLRLQMAEGKEEDQGKERDLNRLQTLLNAAIVREDYSTAATTRNQMNALLGKADDALLPGWEGLGTPLWLVDRLERMGFKLPAAVQRNAMNRIAVEGRDTVIASPTGSGKSLAYLVPLLSVLSDELLDADVTRYFQQFKTPEDEREKDSEAPATPLAVICVPARELGVQVALLAFQLLGGQRNNPAFLPERIPSNFEPGSKTNMFSYKGPRKVKVMGVWDDKLLNASMPIEDYGLDLLRGVHIVVGTPYYLGELAKRGHLPLDNARVIVVDEADACMLSSSESEATGSEAGSPFLEGLTTFMDSVKGKVAKDGKPRVKIFAGASLFPAQMEEAVKTGWLEAPCVIGQNTDMLVSDEGGLEAGLGGQIVPPSLKHFFIQSEEGRALGLLARLMRFEVQKFRDQGGDEPRIIIYAKDSATAVQIANPLQQALWTGLGGQADAGLWGMSVLLPSAEDSSTFLDADGKRSNSMMAYESSLRVMEMFTFNQINVLVTTPLATRGLDFPAVTHVFNLGLVGSAADYLHRAGRAGRIGQAEAGKIVNLLDEEGVLGLQKLEKTLQFDAVRMDESEIVDHFAATDASDSDSKVRFLEDVFQLFDSDGGEDGKTS